MVANTKNMKVINTKVTKEVPTERAVSGSSISNEAYDEIIQDLLDCDKVRVKMDSYPRHILSDPDSGHWELWEGGNERPKIALTNRDLIARNPVYDALNNRSGVVGIDFGTKSTVVVYRGSRADVLPMRVGGGEFSKVATRRDYENPTVMELRDAGKFMGDYRKYEGRPYTRWEDLLISHEAFSQLNSAMQGNTFASFFSEFKQWASDKTKQVNLKDSQGQIWHLPAYLELKEGDFDPIEIYAYYLGLFINNMAHGIYLRYKLSFPATVEKQVKDKILESFTKGIKKSLPVQVLHDSTCMSIFKVEQGASEPAAYAISALNGYNFDPEGDEKYYYGIFDFGGGTTDFDFGVWSSEEDEPENYDYQISHFGQGGDPYLGGENLLEVLSYRVFLNNYEKLLQDEICFIRPSGEKEVVGKEHLIQANSQYANFNHKRMMEKLRGVWEGNAETRAELQDGILQVALFNKEGKPLNNYTVEVDLNELDQLLESRIDRGVAQFFDALQNNFGSCEEHSRIYDSDGVNIFLGGNSSKSPLVYRAFKKHIESFAAKLNDNLDWDRLKIYPPLGTAMSDAILEGSLQPRIDDLLAYLDNPEVAQGDSERSDSDSLEKTTGKTGVAYGLLNNRVRVCQNEAEEIGFKYYIGQNRRNKFYCVINKDEQKYNVWVKFCAASREEFDIWFTRSSTAPTNKIPIGEMGVYSEPGFVDNPGEQGKSVFIRLISPTEIEYVVASDAEINGDYYDGSTLRKLILQEKD